MGDRLRVRHPLVAADEAEDPVVDQAGEDLLQAAALLPERLELLPA